MQNLALRLAALALLALGPGADFRTLFAGDVRLTDGELRLEGHKVLLRGVGYAPLALGAQPTDPVLPCVYARDLPLMAAMGANTIRTFSTLPDGDSALVALLSTTGLNWLAGFPLDPWYDSTRTLASRRDEILAAFRAYASRFRGERRLVGFVFGEHMANHYADKFAGAVEDFYTLLSDAAMVLAKVDPDTRPLLATSTADTTELEQSPSGLDFWVWDAERRPTLAAAIEDAAAKSSRPVLIGAYAPPNNSDEGAEAAALLGLTREVFSSPTVLGGIYSAWTADSGGGGLFQLAASEVGGLDSVLPRAPYGVLAAEWGGMAPPAWQMTGSPFLASFVHAASSCSAVAPGTLVRFSGERLAPMVLAANGIPWPLHLGQFAACVGGSPAPLAMVSEEQGSALIPWDNSTGDQPVVLFRAGVATNRQTARVRTYAPGIFEGAVLRSGSNCRVTAENGARPGDVLEIYASGLGPGAPSWMTPSVSINGTAAEVLYSGTMPTLVGLNQVNVRLSPQTPASTAATLLLRSGTAAAPPYPISVAGEEDRFGIALTGPSNELVLQAGGAGKVIEIGAEGRNGYCGPVVLTLESPPSGVVLQSPVGVTGSSIPVQIRAAEDAVPQTGTSLILAGQAPGVIGTRAAVKLTVLAGQGDVPVRVISGGYKSAPLARFDWNGRTLFSTTGGGTGRGINVITADPATGVFSTVRNFDTWGEDTASSSLVGYINSLPAGTVAFFAVADDASLRLSTQARAVIAATFGSRFIESLAYQESWALLGRKGAAAPIGEAHSVNSQVTLEHTVRFPAP